MDLRPSLPEIKVPALVVAGTDDRVLNAVEAAQDTMGKSAQDLIGFDVHPGTPTSVHHVLLFAVPSANVATAQAADAAEAGPGWTCFGGSGVDAAQTIGGWVPGSGASMFPPPTGIHLAAGTQIIVQIRDKEGKVVTSRTEKVLHGNPVEKK